MKALLVVIFLVGSVIWGYYNPDRVFKWSNGLTHYVKEGQWPKPEPDKSLPPPPPPPPIVISVTAPVLDESEYYTKEAVRYADEDGTSGVIAPATRVHKIGVSANGSFVVQPAGGKGVMVNPDALTRDPAEVAALLEPLVPATASDIGKPVRQVLEGKIAKLDSQIVIVSGLLKSAAEQQNEPRPSDRPTPLLESPTFLKTLLTRMQNERNRCQLDLDAAPP